MYIEGTTNYYKGTEQRTRRGRFLLLVQDRDLPTGPDNFRGIVRKVALRQYGHYMMGVARIAGESILVSGSYGGNGLPTNVHKKIFNKAVPIPLELYDKWSNGEGWNTCGNEAEALREWAKDEFLE